MKNCRVIAGFSGIAGAFFSLYILFVGPTGIDLWYQAIVTLLLVSGGTMLLISEKLKASYFAAGAHLISLVVITMQFSNISRYTAVSADSISNYIFLMFLGFSLSAFLFSLVSIFEREYGRETRFKRVK